MNILILYTNSPMVGAGGPVFDIFNEFIKKGHHVKVLVNSYAEDYPVGIISMETLFQSRKNEFVSKILTKLGLNKKIKSNPDYHFQDLAEQKTYYSTRKLLRKAAIKPDAIIVFFAKNFINTRNIHELNKQTGAPIYWVFYDMAPMTGGCHYAWECAGYQNQCGNCPGLYSDNPYDITNKNLQYKKKYLDKTDIRVIVGTEWQYRQAKKSALFKNYAVHKIITAMNDEIFKPVPKEVARRTTGIPFEKKVIFFGAVYLDHKRKGFEYLLSALKILKSLVKNNPELADNILLVVAGQEFDSIKDQMPFEYHYMGMLDNGPGIASAYQAADIFVCPSIEDSGPTMINQSIMAGTPVISFETGVALDLVINGKTGYRARLRDSHDLASGMLKILSLPDSDYQEMKNNCRNMALEMFHPDVNFRNWSEIIKKR